VRYDFTKPPPGAIQFPMIDFPLQKRHGTGPRLTMTTWQGRAEK
jgi:hypothetical protein